MADTLTPKERSALMARVQSYGNASTELRMIAIFRQLKIAGWRRKQKLPGKPDFVFQADHLALFVDGCFWHGCAKCYRRPKSNRDYWDAKVRRNMARDRLVECDLRSRNWRILRIWEHEFRYPTRVANKVIAAIQREEQSNHKRNQ